MPTERKEVRLSLGWRLWLMFLIFWGTILVVSIPFIIALGAK